MKIDEACINHNVARLTRETVMAVAQLPNPNADIYKMALSAIGGMCDLAEAMKEVLKS